ncbi:MAG: DUF4184 family protein [Terracidiphilus sp.]|jgi:hypothetical protein
MPFTLAHAAAAIPFRRTRLIPSALVVGCLSPDFEYFLRLAPKGGFGHTLAGLFAFDLPASLLILWLFYAYAREPILTWLPTVVRRRIAYSSALFPVRNVRQIVLVLVSIVIGGATHILWDSFTHPFFWPYRHWHFLSHMIQLPFIGPVRWYKILQHLSTAVGLMALLLWLFHWYRTTVPCNMVGRKDAEENGHPLLAFMCLAAVFAGLLRGFFGVGIPTNMHGCEALLADSATAAITVLWLEIVAYGIVRKKNRGRLTGA